MLSDDQFWYLFQNLYDCCYSYDTQRCFPLNLSWLLSNPRSSFNSLRSKTVYFCIFTMKLFVFFYNIPYPISSNSHLRCDFQLFVLKIFSHRIPGAQKTSYFHLKKLYRKWNATFVLCMRLKVYRVCCNVVFRSSLWSSRRRRCGPCKFWNTNFIVNYPDWVFLCIFSDPPGKYRVISRH